MLDFALPPRCAGCGASSTERSQLLRRLLAERSTFSAAGCETCGLPLRRPSRRCAAACLRAAAADRADRAPRSAYGESARRLAHAAEIRAQGRSGADHGAVHGAAGGEWRATTLLVPVPLHRWRLWGRGFNQSALVAARAGATAGHWRSTALLLERIRRTPPLKGMEPRRAAARRSRARSRLRDRAAADGRTVVLIDDVMTTGSTADACAEALRRAGAARVELVSWARVVRAGAFVR